MATRLPLGLDRFGVLFRNRGGSVPGSQPRDQLLGGFDRRRRLQFVGVLGQRFEDRGAAALAERNLSAAIVPHDVGTLRRVLRIFQLEDVERPLSIKLEQADGLAQIASAAFRMRGRGFLDGRFLCFRHGVFPLLDSRPSDRLRDGDRARRAVSYLISRPTVARLFPPDAMPSYPGGRRRLCVSLGSLFSVYRAHGRTSA